MRQVLILNAPSFEELRDELHWLRPTRSGELNQNLQEVTKWSVLLRIVVSRVTLTVVSSATGDIFRIPSKTMLHHVAMLLPYRFFLILIRRFDNCVVRPLAVAPSGCYSILQRFESVLRFTYLRF
jgi:hypothetical protein